MQSTSFIIRRRPLLSNQFLTCNIKSRSNSNSAVPPNAPKQLPNIQAIRAEPELFSRNAQLRNYLHHVDTPRRIVSLSEDVARLEKVLLPARTELKRLEKVLVTIKSGHRDGDEKTVLEEIGKCRAQVDKSAAHQGDVMKKAYHLALKLPNLTSSFTPTDGQPKVLKYLNYDASAPPQPQEGAEHSVIGPKLGIIDFSSASSTTGWGFYYLRNEGVLLEQALIQYAQSVTMRRGWKLATPPSLVYSHIADACGFQPRDANDEQQIWQIAQPAKLASKPPRSLAATAEIPLAALYASKDIPQSELPLKLVGTSRCYRAEAGARGVDTKGLYRVHEFTKTEMFAWTESEPHTPEEIELEDVSQLKHPSEEVFEEMVDIQCEILSSLGLPCRVLEMPTSDLGASAFRKIDIEAFFPSRIHRDEGWGELSSVSMCTDYQSRRLSTRIRSPDGSNARFAHTLNGTAMAVPRVMACIIENNWNHNGKFVAIPAVLQPFMGGIEKVSMPEKTPNRRKKDRSPKIQNTNSRQG